MPMQVDSSLQSTQGYGMGQRYNNHDQRHHYQNQGSGDNRYANAGVSGNAYVYENARQRDAPHHPSYNVRAVHPRQQYGGTPPRKGVPVLLKIIPLELTSQYIQEALKTMSFIPLPVSVLGHGQHRSERGHHHQNNEPSGQYMDYGRHARTSARYAGGGGDGGGTTYADYGNGVIIQQGTAFDPELPPPSSHVATPPRNPASVDVVYDDDVGVMSYYGGYPRGR